jgi:hypothetical protein
MARRLSTTDDGAFASTGCPIRKSGGLSLLGGSPLLIAAFHVLHRLLAPRHPPCTLGNLTLDFLIAVFSAVACNRPHLRQLRPASRFPLLLKGAASCHLKDAFSYSLFKELRAPLCFLCLARCHCPNRIYLSRDFMGRHSLCWPLTRRQVVEMTGIEPATSGLQSPRSPC